MDSSILVNDHCIHYKRKRRVAWEIYVVYSGHALALFPWVDSLPFEKRGICFRQM